MQNLQKQIDTLESRQLTLKTTMASSDAYAAKCTKLGKSFSEAYPQEYEAYKAANEEFNTNETTLAELYSQREALISEQQQVMAPIEENEL